MQGSGQEDVWLKGCNRAIGYEDCFYGEGVCLIEWSQLIPEILPEHVIRIRIEKDLEQGFDYRKITVEGLEK